MEIDYDTLTAEQIEEHVEFIDWSLIPSKLITVEIKEKFKSIPQLKARVWFENLLSQMVIRVDPDAFPDRIFYFIGEEYQMEFYFKNKELYCSYERICAVFINDLKIKATVEEIKLFIKNVVELYFPDMEVTPCFITFEVVSWVEMHLQVQIRATKAFNETSK